MDTLKVFFQTLPHGDYKPIRDEIVKECGISRATFSAWANGRYAPAVLAQKTINQIIRRYGYDEIYNDKD